MTYKENYYFKKYYKKHPELRNSVDLLERFCRDEHFELHIYGSTLRSDYYFGLSDCDTIISCDNIDKAVARIEYLIHHNDNIQIVEKYHKQQMSINNIPHIKDNCTSAILIKVNINGIPFDLNILNCQDFGKPYHLKLLPGNGGIVYVILLSILKFLHYSINIMPKWLYVSIKKSSRVILDSRYTLIKRSSW